MLFSYVVTRINIIMGMNLYLCSIIANEEKNMTVVHEMRKRNEGKYIAVRSSFNSSYFNLSDGVYYYIGYVVKWEWNYLISRIMLERKDLKATFSATFHYITTQPSFSQDINRQQPSFCFS